MHNVVEIEALFSFFNQVLLQMLIRIGQFLILQRVSRLFDDRLTIDISFTVLNMNILFQTNKLGQRIDN